MAIGPWTSQALSLRSDRARIRLGRYVATKLEPKLGRYVATKLEPKLGRYVATEHERGSVSTYRPSSSQTRSLRIDRARTRLGRYVAIGLSQNIDTTRIHAFSSTL
ncbi:hypothetical protein F2Q69_00053527 [Brassica cretica]|uniref:Uncharacterized protein n=1 Tax=Brassica cretica TaxID=69181 RepID=A0A8S9N957_BRACR|nr:hypothetical protein F2Q69_00053527 [Brassica cretica]